jgi:hypothetical protein
LKENRSVIFIQFNMLKNIFCFALFLTVSHIIQAQGYVITGKVIETESGNPVPFANVIVTGTTLGTTTNFDGIFTLELRAPVDSISVSYIGFKPKSKKVNGSQNQLINIHLEEDVMNLENVVVIAGENPAFPIMRSIIENRKANNKLALNAYQYEAYTKIELDINHITQQFRDRKLIKKITSVLDSIEQIAGDDGLPILPVFISEAISNYYYKKSPKLTHEDIIRTKLSGVGVEDGSLTSQVIGSTFQQYNFYNNWLSLFSKDFASPIGFGWKGNYEYDLVDSLYIEDSFCYRLEFWPKRSQDLAFSGTMWITKEEYALKQIDASVLKSANLNFIEKLKIQQKGIKTTAGPWLPEKTRVLVDIAEVTKNTAGILAKFYVSLDDIKVNDPKNDKFYEEPISFSIDTRKIDDNYWNDARHDPLSETELNVFNMIDTLKSIPIIKTYTDIIQTLGTGHFKVGMFDIGPYWSMYSKNDVEGFRLGFGARTNSRFSDKWIVSGMGNYGFKDEEWKYRGKLKRIISRRPWTTASISHVKELDPIWVLNDDDFNSSAYIGFARWGSLTKPFRHHETTLKFESVLFKGFTQSIKLKQQKFQSLDKTNFKYNLEPGLATSGTASGFNTTEIVLESRISRDELFVVNDNNRISLGAIKWPIIKLKYTLGIKGALDSDFDYHKLELGIEKKVRLGVFGYSKVDVVGGYVFSQLPYPLLKVHTGNEFPVYFDFTFNLLNFFEFTSDRYVELRYRHHFEGFILNRIPLMKKLKWRLLGNVNMIAGGVRPENEADINTLVTASDGSQVLPFNTFDEGKPYVEVGYGIENIFKIIRISAFHRLTYTDVPNAQNFGIKLNFQLIL